MRADDRHAGKGVQHAGQALRARRARPRAKGGPPRVEGHRQAERLNLLIDGGHLLVVHKEVLVVGVELDAVQAQGLDAVQLLERVGRVGVHGAKAVEPLALYGGGEVVDLVHGVHGGGDVQRHGAVHAPLVQPAQRALERAVGEVGRVLSVAPGDMGQLGQGLFCQRLRKHVHMKVNQHLLTAFLPSSILLGKLYPFFAALRKARLQRSAKRRTSRFALSPLSAIRRSARPGRWRSAGRPPRRT